MAVQRDYHQVLGVDRDASQEEIRRAYWKLAKQWHPDRCYSGSSKKRREHVDRFIEVSDAYRALRNSQSQNLPPIMTDLSPDQEGPRPAGSTVVWTAKASDPDGDPVYYKFWLQGPSTDGIWTDMTGWIIDNKWAWKTGPKDAGNNTIKAEVRDGLHAEPEGWDDWETAECRIIRKGPMSMPAGLDMKKAALVLILILVLGIAWMFIGGEKSPDPELGASIQDAPEIPVTSQTAAPPQAQQQQNQAPTVVSLDPDKKSPQKAGTTVKWIASAGDPEGDNIYYQFLIQGPATGNRWETVSDWSTGNVWIWSTSARDSGSSRVMVRIRDGLHEGAEGYDAASAHQMYSIINLPDGGVRSAL